MMFKGKKLLLIVPIFYGYENRIKKALECEGLIVETEYIYKVSRWMKLMSKLNNKLYKTKCDHYYNHIIERHQGNTLDYILVVDGKGLTDYFVRQIIDDHPEAMTIYYSWDSLLYFDYLPWLKIFDRVYTFDSKDTKQYGIKYLPLFYTPELEEVGNKDLEKEYDLLFIATYKENRLNFINSIKDKYNTLNIKVVLYLSIYRYIIDSIKGRRIRMKDVIFHPLPFNQYLELLSKAKVVLDYTPSTQSGLPMRIPEAIGAKMKIITNNKYVSLEFNNNPNILVYKENEDIIPFINSGKTEMKERVNYSVSNWIRSLLS